MSNDTRTLRTALRVNAGFSGLCGLALLVAPASWSAVLGVPWPWVLAALGIGLAGFSAVVAWAAADVAGRARVISTIIAADALWVVASPAAMLAGAGTLTAVGQAAVGAVAVIVALLAAGQWWGLRAARTAAHAGHGQHGA
jgi:hypothetical protein